MENPACRSAAGGESSPYILVGGRAAINDLVPRFYALALTDPVLAPHFHGVEMGRLACGLAEFLTTLLDGPGRYGGRRLREAHRHLHVTDADFDRAIDALGKACQTAELPPGVTDVILERVRRLRAQIIGDPAPPDQVSGAR